MSKSKLALLDDSNFPTELIEVGQNIRDVSEKDDSIKELADSIKQYGLLEPIGIEIEENLFGKYKLVYGHRRLLAVTKILKWKSVKVVRVLGNNRVETQLIENIHRKDLTDLELAEALKKIQEQTKSKNKDLAKIVSKSVDWIESKLIHLKTFNSLPEETKEQAKKLSTDKIKVIRNLPEAKKKELITKDSKENLTTRAFKNEVKKVSGKSETSRKSDSITTNTRETNLEFVIKRLLNVYKDDKDIHKSIVRQLKAFNLMDLLEESRGK